MALRRFRLVFSLAFSIVSAALGYEAADWYVRLSIWGGERPLQNFEFIYTVAFIALGFLVGFSVSGIIFRQILELGRSMQRIPAADKLAGILGIILGLVLTALLGVFVWRIRTMGPLLTLLLAIPCIYGGATIALSMRRELYYLFPGLAADASGRADAGPGCGKLLDTNVLIDGRIAEICKTGFVDGPIYVPGFVLAEMQFIADSADPLRRNRGRRGLEILAQMQREPKSPVMLLDDYGDSVVVESDPVDLKLVRLARSVSASIITNDYNLNKVAQVHGVSVLNVNELANAVKPAVLPGEEMTITVLKKGTESNQGVGYLDDGTMVVVENGEKHIGETVPVVVSTHYQTAAGKMIFTHLKETGELSDDGSEMRAHSGSGGRKKARYPGH